MKISPENVSFFASKIAESEASLQQLEWEIEEIGQPAAQELKRRLDALRVEENALKRNIAEALGMNEPDEARMEKIEVLLAYIQREEASVKHEADFLHQSPPTSAEFAARAGSQLVELCLRAMKRVLGDHHPLGMSVFVNHSHETLASQYGLESAASGESEVR
jgi:chromosome segregation ATPase